MSLKLLGNRAILCLLIPCWGGVAVRGAEQQTLRISLPLSPPMGYRDADGKPQGFTVEALEMAARHAGLTLSWRVIGGMQANNDALRANELDIVAGFDTAERRREFFVSDPWWSSDLIILSTAAKAIKKEGDLAGRRLAVGQGPAGTDIGLHYPASRIIPAATATAAAEAVCGGAADAGVIESMYLRELLFAAPHACNGVGLRTLDSTARVDYVLVSTQAAAGATRALKKALDAITLDGTLASIAARHPPISTPYANRLEELLRAEYQRKSWIIVSAAGAIIALLGTVFIIRQHRARNRLKAAFEQLHLDLAARERAETAQRDSEARFRALFDSAPQTVIAFDNSGKIAFANRKSQEMFGRSIPVGSNIAVLMPEQWRGAVRQGFAKTPNMTGLRADGTEFPIEVHSGAVETDEGLTLAFIADVSERVGLQQQLLQSQKLESIGQLAGGIAHDFNNLLTVIIGYTQMLLDETDARDALHEPLSQIGEAAERAAALTRQLLMFGRRQATNPKVLSLNDLLANVDKMLRRLIGEDIELILCTEDVGLIRADPGHIEQVVMNLAVNARDAMPEGGKLTIRTTNFHVDSTFGSGHGNLGPGDYVMLRVTDTGTGMTPEVQAHIFEPFFTTKEQGKGTGLGLSTVYGIVRQSGGEVLVYSEPGSGTTFNILLPVAEGQIQQDVPAPHAIRSHGHETILLAEDDPGVRRFIKDVLAVNGYKVLEAVDGRAALELAAQYAGPIHLVLSDMVMPQVGGTEVAERIRELYPGSAILHMSGYSDRRTGPEAPGLIEKPFTPSALLDRIREVLDGRSADLAASRA